MISKGKESIDYTTLDDLLRIVSEGNILAYYFDITKVPCTVKSPLRTDKKPSFGFFSPDGNTIMYKDFASGERGSIFNLLQKIWCCTFKEVVQRIKNDMAITCVRKEVTYIRKKANIIKKECSITKTPNNLECKIRDWLPHDIEYWKSFGISLEWLKYAEIYPISHKIIIKDYQRIVFGADKYAYAYVEHKDNNTTLKIYQPFNKNGFKWQNKHDQSVISLWTKIPEKGDRVCICSSMKDALCLWANIGIPSIAIQGEGYPISDTAQKELKRRYKNIYILLDNDEVGLKDGEKLSKETGFINLILPIFEGGKDISDLYKVKGKDFFIKTIKNLFL